MHAQRHAQAPFCCSCHRLERGRAILPLCTPLPPLLLLQIGNAVVVARILNATLVLPRLDTNDFWNDSRYPSCAILFFAPTHACGDWTPHRALVWVLPLLVEELELCTAMLPDMLQAAIFPGPDLQELVHCLGCLSATAGSLSLH